MNCPRCGSHRISNREAGMRSCASIGGLFGAATGVNAALRGAQVGVTIGAPAGPVGMTAGGLVGVMLSGVLSGSAGAALGSLVGRVMDANFLDNRTCLECGITFRQSSEAASLNVHVTAGEPASRHARGATPHDEEEDPPAGFFYPPAT